MKEIKLTNSKRIALIDDEDEIRVNQHNWYLKLNPYGYPESIRSHINGECLNLGRFILGPSDLPKVDHKDGNCLNNQKFNLRNDH